jgi:hypothetical protein
MIAYPEYNMVITINLLVKVYTGRVIPINKKLKDKLSVLYEIEKNNKDFDIYTSKVVATKRFIKISPPQ